jgi:hypothetical protein
VTIPNARTSSRTVAYERSYEAHVTYEQVGCLIVGGDEGIAGVTDPQLEGPIDFEVELAKRKDRVPLDEVPAASDSSNETFGI